MSQGEFVGVDGCRGGWFSVGLDRDGGLGSHRVFGSFAELLEHNADADLVLVDMPIGLPEGSGGRACDKEARGELKPFRSSSVFPTPTRQAVRQAARAPKDYYAASLVERQFTKKGLTKQTFNIACKIAQVDDALRCRGVDARPQVREVHPEVCFWALSHRGDICTCNRTSMSHNKKRSAGEEERIRVLEHHLPQARTMYNGLADSFPRNRVAKDDILDAMAAAVTGWLVGVGKGKLATLPSVPQMDAEGLPMEMVYCEPLLPVAERN